MPDDATDAMLARLPELEDGVRFPAIDPALTAELCAALVAAAPASIAALAGRLNAVDDGSDWKVRFLLHALATRVAAPGRDADRASFLRACEALLDDAHPPHVQAFIASQVQLAGDASVLPSLASRLNHADGRLVDAAASAMVAIGEAAAPFLREAVDGSPEHSRRAIENALAQLA